jgi:hypothetical protein
MPCDLRCAVNAQLSETGGVPVVRFTAVLPMCEASASSSTLSGPPMRQPQMRTGMPEPKLPSVGPLAVFRLEVQARATTTVTVVI